MRVFIIDDCSITVAMIANMLIVNGIDCQYTDVINKKTYKKLKDYEPDLILLDIILKDANGVDVARNIHKVEGLHKIPIVAISTEDNLVTKVLINSNDFYSFINKPIKVDSLITTVKQFGSLGKLFNIESKFLKQNLKVQRCQ